MRSIVSIYCACPPTPLFLSNSSLLSNKEYTKCACSGVIASIRVMSPPIATEASRKKKARKQIPVAEEISSSRPSGERKKNDQVKNQGEIPILAATVVAIPPPFVIPPGTTHLSDVAFPIGHKRWKLTKKLARDCSAVSAVKEITAKETKRLRKIHVPIEASDVVLCVYARADDEGGVTAKFIERNALPDLRIERTHRFALLTRGTLQFKKFSFRLTDLLKFAKKVAPTVVLSLFDLRGIHVCDSGDNLVIVAFRQQRAEDEQEEPHAETIRYAMYQTPETSRLLLPLTEAIAAAYASVPRWAIPISFSGELPPFSAIPRSTHLGWLGHDGGFSSSVYAAALSFHVKHKIDFGGFPRVSQAVMKQQPTQTIRALATVPREIDLPRLVESLNADKQESRAIALLLAALNAMTFNLVFRKLKLARIKHRDAKLRLLFQNTLARALMYNVTLREVDFESSDLNGFGDTIGRAWALNGTKKWKINDDTKSLRCRDSMIGTKHFCFTFLQTLSRYENHLCHS